MHDESMFGGYQLDTTDENRLGTLLGQNGGGLEFDPIGGYALTSGGLGSLPGATASGQFNTATDDDLDVVAAVPGLVEVYLGNGTGALGAGTDFSMSGTGDSLAVGDYDDDGKQDILAADLGGNDRGAPGERRRHVRCTDRRIGPG